MTASRLHPDIEAKGENPENRAIWDRIVKSVEIMADDPLYNLYGCMRVSIDIESADLCLFASILKDANVLALLKAIEEGEVAMDGYLTVPYWLGVMVHIEWELDGRGIAWSREPITAESVS